MTHMAQPATSGQVTSSTAAAAARLAADVTAVQWPISTFIARHPWPALEGLPFQTAMRKLQAQSGVRLYPSMSVFFDAMRRGEIDPRTLEVRMKEYLEHAVPEHLREPFAALQEALTHEAEEAPDISPAAMALAVQAASAPNLPDEALRFALPSDEERERVDALTIRYLKLYLDRGQSAWAMPRREEGLYSSVRALAERDPALRREERRRVQEMPNAVDDALAFGLAHFAVDPEFAADYFRVHFLRFPGFVGALRYFGRAEGREEERLREFLAVRVLLEWAIAGGARRSFLPHPNLAGLAESAEQMLRRLNHAAGPDLLLAVHRYLVVDRYAVWLEAWEETLEAELMALQGGGPRACDAPVAQLLFCIDVRSEKMRRHLEQVGPYQTFGCAGFFNLPVWTRSLDNAYAHPSCPAIVEPVAELREEPLHAGEMRTYRALRGGLRAATKSFKTAKQNSVASLALPEVSSPWLGMGALVLMVPRVRAALGRGWRRVAPVPKTSWAIEAHEAPGAEGMGPSAEDLADRAADLLRSIGLTRFAPIVVVCGHEARVENQAHGAAFDCGACGGASGRANARAFAALLNRRDVRSRLAEHHGIRIPESTQFVAAVHVTTTDEIAWLDVPALSGDALRAFEALRKDAMRACEQARRERCLTLPAARPALSEANRRAHDWSEVRPEWGLAGNRVFWVGMFRDLARPEAGDSFLHSYDFREDPDLRLLRAIVDGPVTVAQWINLQYYASTVAPHVHGAGGKPTMTVTAGIGVMQGNGSDLLPGLPWQSVASDDLHLYHRPLRLTVVIEAPEEAVRRLLREDEPFRRKVEGGWLRLWVRDPVRGAWVRGQALARVLEPHP